MDNLNRNFGYGHPQIEFSDRFTTPDNLQNFSAALLQNTHMNYMQQRNLSRESVFGHHSSSDIQSSNTDFTAGSRYSSLTLPDSSSTELPALPDPSINIVTSNQQRSSASSQTLPHISGFINPSLPLFRTPISLAEPNSRQNETRPLAGFGSIIASAASHISTMDIPPPLIDVSADRQSTSPCIQQSSTTTGFVPGISHGPRYSFLNSGQPSMPISSNRIHNPDLNHFPHIPPINVMPPYLDENTGSRSDSGTSLSNSTRHSDLSFPFRHLHAEDSIPPINSIDGDQQVPNAVMSPASGCPSPSIRSTSTPFLPQSMIPFQQRNAAVSDSPSVLRNELTFADSTFVDSEICKSLDTENSTMTGSQESQSESLHPGDNRQQREGCNSDLRHDSSPQQNQQSKNSVIKAKTSMTSDDVEQTSRLGYFTERNKSESILMNENIENISPIKSNVSITDEDSFNDTNGHTSSFELRNGQNKYNVSDNSSLNESRNMKKTASPKKGNNSKSIKEPSMVPFIKLGTTRYKQNVSRSLNLNKPPKDLNTSDAPLKDEKDKALSEAPTMNVFEMRKRFLANWYNHFGAENKSVIVESNPTTDASISCLDENELNYVDYEKEESGAKRRKGRRPGFFHLKNEVKDYKSDDDLNEEYLVKSESDIDLPLDISLDDSLCDNRKSPKRPFAITSPSFNKAAAKAVMTTTVADNATLVTISIMNKKAGKKGRTKTVNINQGNISSPSVSKSMFDSEDKKVNSDFGNREEGENEDELGKNCDEDTLTNMKSELGIDKLSIMSKLKREKEENSNELDRMEINVRIDDSQLVQHGEQKRWQCHLCPKSYTTKHNLVTHVLDHNGIKPHLCMVCGKYFKQLSHLNTHMLTHDHLKPHVCHVCGKGFTQISHLKRHQAVHLEAKPYICDICNRGFAYPSELRSHKDKHAQGKDRCEDCGEDFDSPRALKLHLMTHENKDDLICKYCNKVFRYPSQLKDHLMSHSGSRPYMCTECGMDFMKEHHLKAHQFTHTGLRPYECPECNRTFNQKANMQRHMLIHNATRAFRCEECGKTFTQPQTLKAHKVVHFENKPYQCKICGKQFGRLHNLQGHLHMHNNTKPYICFCGSSFTLKGNLNRHKKVKHGLNETTESMEEEAVNFLNTLSERARTSLDDEYDEENEMYDLEPDLNESENQPELIDSENQSLNVDSKSQRKGRKSVPRKISVNSDNPEIEDEEEEEMEGQQDDLQEDHKSRSHYFDKSNDSEEKKEYTLKTEEISDEDEKKESGKMTKIKSLRKRKAKEMISDLHEDEDESEKEEKTPRTEEEDKDWTPEETTRRKSGKAAKLDSIIEQKFKKS